MSKLPQKNTTDNPYPCLVAALRYAKRGWSVFPLWWRKGDSCGCGDPKCKDVGKHPLGPAAPQGFKNATTDEKTIRRWWRQYPNAGIGVATGKVSGIVVIDIDQKNDKDGTLALGALTQKLLCALPPTKSAVTPSGGTHLYYEYVVGMRSSSDKLGVGLDIRADGGYVAAPPSHSIYKWTDGRSVEPLPQQWITYILELDKPSKSSGAAASDPAADLKLVGAALEVIPNDASVDRDKWIRIGLATHAATSVSEAGFNLFDHWSQKWPNYDADDTAKAWAGFRPNNIGLGSLIHFADEASPGWRGNRKAQLAVTQTEHLIKLAAEAELFHTDDDTAYADLDVDGHWETWPVRSPGFSRWLRHRYFLETQSAPNPESLRNAISTMEALALFEGPKRKVFLRTAATRTRLCLDLADDQWRAVEIDQDGWRVVDDPPVRFLRRPNMLPLPLPLPVKGGAVRELRKYVNLSSEEDFILVVAYLVAALRHFKNYPILDANGEAGSAKSTLIKILRDLFDPSSAPLRAPPRNNRDFFIAARNSYGVSFDNLSVMPDWLSDSMCRLATGGGFGTRKLYSDDDEQVFDGVRPQISGSVGNVIIRGDLADRCTSIRLSGITDKARRDEATLWKEFYRDRPAILGALLDLVVRGLRELPRTKVERKPRMADFYLWAIACTSGLWPGGNDQDGNLTPTFARAYAANRAQRSSSVIEADIVAIAIQDFMRGRDGGPWIGSASKLLGLLDQQVDDRQHAQRSWPKGANYLSNRLTRVAPELRNAGIDVKMSFDRMHNRIIEIAWVAASVSPASPASPASLPNQGDAAGDTARDLPHPLRKKHRKSGVAGGAGGAGDTDARTHGGWDYQPNRAAQEARLRNALRDKARRSRR